MWFGSTASTSFVIYLESNQSTRMNIEYVTHIECVYWRSESIKLLHTLVVSLPFVHRKLNWRDIANVRPIKDNFNYNFIGFDSTHTFWIHVFVTVSIYHRRDMKKITTKINGNWFLSSSSSISFIHFCDFFSVDIPLVKSQFTEKKNKNLTNCAHRNRNEIKRKKFNELGVW